MLFVFAFVSVLLLNMFRWYCLCFIAGGTLVLIYAQHCFFFLFIYYREHCSVHRTIRNCAAEPGKKFNHIAVVFIFFLFYFPDLHPPHFLQAASRISPSFSSNWSKLAAITTRSGLSAIFSSSSLLTFLPIPTATR